MTKSQLKELQKDAEASFNEYLAKCQKLGMIDPSTGMPLSQED
jgi:predicted HicB family RNase H-like nuclease